MNISDHLGYNLRFKNLHYNLGNNLGFANLLNNHGENRGYWNISYNFPKNLNTGILGSLFLVRSSVKISSAGIVETI